MKIVLGVLAFAWLAALPAFAQLRDLPEGKDHPIVSRYAGSIILGYDARNFDEFQLPLGPIRRLDTEGGIEVEPSRSQRLEGRVTRILYVAPGNRSPREVLRNYEQELAARAEGDVYASVYAGTGWRRSVSSVTPTTLGAWTTTNSCRNGERPRS
jgi:hypothetical protein